jgi:inhibitor of KinA
MSDQVPIFKPLGESALVVEFGSEILIKTNSLIIALTEKLAADPFVGFREAVPAYASATVFFDLVSVRRGYPQFKTAHDAVKNIVSTCLESVVVVPESSVPVTEIPAEFSASCGPDLEYVAVKCGCSISEVIEIFLSRTYRVYMIGFLPGFAYMGEVDERIRMPRKQQPRERVPKGSIGIAGAQTGVYPLSTPGGWQLIGRTEIDFFTPNGASPSLLKAGDLVRFSAL